MAFRTYDTDFLMTYDCSNNNFHYTDSLCKEFSIIDTSVPFWELLSNPERSTPEVADDFQTKIQSICKSNVPHASFCEYSIKNSSGLLSWYRIGFICPVPGSTITITCSDITRDINHTKLITQRSEHDELTGLLNHRAFCERVEKIVNFDRQGIDCGEYALAIFDVIRFKAVNDIFGMEEGDKLLKYIGQILTNISKPTDIICRSNADHFIIFTRTNGQDLETLIHKILRSISEYDLAFEITCNVGIYITNDSALSADSMIDRAILAQSTIKGSYTVRLSYYTESLRNDMLTEQEIVGMMSNALVEKHFIVYYQPQYNHSTGTLVGAEALVRWKHPERGLISPGLFVPIFEKNGFITKLDLYVFEQVCAFIRRSLDSGLSLAPISTNFSRHDIFQQNFVEKLEEIRIRHNVPVEFLRIEITESAIVGGTANVNEILRKLHKFGYIVEMDDFGSGYSSLNVLKDIELDIIKLDMMFLSSESDNNRGGTIVSAVIRMAKWLGIPVIAEGVETISQADFLKSIGCDYIQGYLYSKPLPEEDFVNLISDSKVGITVSQMRLLETLNACNFWNPESQETLIFSNYVGGAAIFDYHNGSIEVLRVNQKYLHELAMNLSEKEILESDLLSGFDETNRKIYMDMINRAIETGEEQECETWRNVTSSCCGEDKICIRCNIRMIGKSDDSYLFYAMIRNITAEKKRYAEILDSERRFMMASEQVNIYYWEYTVATKEMRPCFRCMRDLGLPALLTNYPDSAIEMGIFPPEVADMYRDWHVQIANGAKELEAIIPLTVGRVPFRVRYTTEFDESGKPVKAYGSAALIV